jgi:hypothetical protein
MIFAVKCRKNGVCGFFMLKKKVQVFSLSLYLNIQQEASPRRSQLSRQIQLTLNSL